MKSAEKLQSSEDESDKKISAADGMTDECTEENHVTARWGDFHTESNKGFFKPGQLYHEVGCAKCGKEPHTGRAKWKDNPDTYDFGSMAQIHCCPRCGWNDCEYYICSACFFKYRE